MNTGLNTYAKIIYSQWGEDGILEEIFNRIGTKNKFCVEFGAGNGFEASNVWHLIEAKGWGALLMDGDLSRLNVWKNLTKDMPRVTLLNTFVDIKGEHSLDSLLTKQKTPKELDLLSIDIDSNDYHILESLKHFTPRVLIIEHNPTIPPVDVVYQAPDEEETFGSSVQANVDLAHKKGYKLVAMTHTNSIFVAESEFAKMGIEEPSIEEVFDWEGLSYVVSAYNGSIYLRNKKNTDKNPSYAWLFKGYTIRLFKNAVRAFTFGFTFNRPYSKSLSAHYQPMKAFKVHSPASPKASPKKK
jgi:hypothetical protein